MVFEMRKYTCAQAPESLKKQLDEKGGIESIAANIPSDKELRAESDFHKAVSEPVRLKILHLLAEQPMCVCVIKSVVRMPDSKLSYHLTVLKDAGLIRGRRRGNWIIYELTKAGRKVVR